jgi:cell division protein FtsB
MNRWKPVPIALTLLLAVLQWRLWIGQGSIAELVSLGRQIDDYSHANEQLRERNRRLEVEVAEFRSGFDSVEEMAREELGLIRRDETFYVVVERPSGAP